MSTEKSTYEIIVLEFVDAFKSLADKMLGNPPNPATTVSFFENLGWKLQNQANPLNKALSFVGYLSTIDTNNPPDIGIVINALKSIISDLSKIKDSVNGLTGDFRTDFENEFPQQILHYTIINHFEKKHEKWAAFLKLTGVFNYDLVTFSPTKSYRLEYSQKKIHWTRLTLLLSDPKKIPEDVYGWSAGTINHELIIENLRNLFEEFFSETDLFLPTPTDISPLTVTNNSLHIPIGDKAGFKVYPVNSPQGLVVSPYFNGGLDQEITIDQYIKLLLKGNLKFNNRSGIEFLPPANLKVVEFNPAGTNSKGEFTMIIQVKGNSGQLLVVGKKDGTRMEVGSAELIVKSTITDSDNEFAVEIGVKNSKIVLDLSDSDGFITKLIPLAPIEINLDTAIGFSTKAGVYFRGSGGLEFHIPTHISLGPLEIKGMSIAVKPETGKIPLSIGTNLKAELGPMTVVIDDIGITSNLSFPENGKGDIGPINLNFGLKPPKGLGLSINAGPVIGGGYLFFDHEKKEYGGALELTIAGLVSAKAIGIITTKMPDGSKGFSLLIIITAEFMPPFQLGFGFTLNGVGGLLGLNRTVLLEPLRDGVRTGAVNSIMFPQNVIANAPRIINDLKTIFPPEEGNFLIGPMAKLGWGTPSLITLSLGLIIELPTGKIAILGVLKIALPIEQAPLVLIQVNFLGTIDFGKKMLTFDASLYESRILFMTLEGDMAVRLSWGENPNFLISVGGFHPSYNPPYAELKSLKRIAMDILNTPVYKIRVSCYQAVTSNTVQFGTKSELKFDLKVCSISGSFAFDALFQFNPFQFIIQLSAQFKLRAVGINLMTVNIKMSLQGPAPWRAKGTGSVSVLFVKISANFDVSWGDSNNKLLPDISVLEKFKAEIQKTENWNANLMNGSNLNVSLRKLTELEKEQLILHPAGTLTVSQKLLPLSVNIELIGNQKIADLRKINIKSVKGGATEFAIRQVKEDFAPAQFFKKTNQEKLSSPSFEKLPGGVEITMDTSSIKNGPMVRKHVKYELTIVDKEKVNFRLKFLKLYTEVASVFKLSLHKNSAAKSIVSQNTKLKLEPFKEKIELEQEGFTIVNSANNRIFDQTLRFESETQARSQFNEMIRQNPEMSTEIHIVSNYEVNT